jgi:hypothetical protein
VTRAVDSETGGSERSPWDGDGATGSATDSRDSTIASAGADCAPGGAEPRGERGQCVIGFDTEFLNEISRRTGAWVTAPRVSIESFPSRGKGLIDHTPAVYNYYNASLPRESAADSSSVPRAIDTFFRHARERTSSSLGNEVAFLLPSP